MLRAAVAEKLEKQSENINEIQSLEASDGTVVSLISNHDQEIINVRCTEGEIIFEYRPESKQCHLYVPEGNLHFGAPNGSVSISSGEDISLQCPGDIVVEGGSEVKLRAGSQLTQGPQLLLSNRSMAFISPKLEMEAEEADLVVARSRLRSRKLAAKIDRVRFLSDHLELVSKRVTQRITNLSQYIDDLCQIDAGRMRMVVRDLFNLKGKRTYFKAEKDMKLKGERIHLR